MFRVLHPEFSRQQLSASWDFLLGRKKTSLLYFFIQDAIDLKLKYNEKIERKARKLQTKSEKNLK